MGVAYVSAGDELARRHFDVEEPFRLQFEGPMRHLYAHGWELCLKACLFQQGTLPSELKYDPGHRLVSAWDAVDKERFAALNLTPATRHFTALLDRYHPTKYYAYPIGGARSDFTVAYVRAASQRFHIAREIISQMFGAHIRELG
jgi:hypothetical protein